MVTTNQPGDDSIRVLVVDDSAYLRKVIARMLSTDPRIQVVGLATDGDDALEKVGILKPDVITLDLEMPRCDGVQFLQAMGREWRIPVVVVSSLSESGAKVMAAMEAGAFDFIQKPTALANEQLFGMAEALVDKVTVAARMSSAQRSLMYRPPPAASVAESTEGTPQVSSSVDIVVIGASTGGPSALRLLLSALPAHFPVPIAVVLHMPVGYTGPFAERLDNEIALEVVEAGPDIELKAGRVVVARAGLHLKLEAKFRLSLEMQPLGLPHRPAVDVLFTSAASVYGARVLAVIMTGMGNDGTSGATAIRAAGGKVLAQSEDTCVVYGMPRAAVEADVVDHVVPLDRLAADITRRL